MTKLTKSQLIEKQRDHNWKQSTNSWEEIFPNMDSYYQHLHPNNIPKAKTIPSASQQSHKYILWVEGGTTPPKVIHDTYESAKNEAKRLATERQLGKRVWILKLEEYVQGKVEAIHHVVENKT